MGEDVGFKQPEKAEILKLWNYQSVLIIRFLLYSHELQMINSDPQKQPTIEIDLGEHPHIFDFLLDLLIRQVITRR